MPFNTYALSTNSAQAAPMLTAQALDLLLAWGDKQNPLQQRFLVKRQQMLCSNRQPVFRFEAAEAQSFTPLVSVEADRIPGALTTANAAVA